MKFFYIDDSYFRKSEFLNKMRSRMFQLAAREQISVIFVSGNDMDKIVFNEFIKSCEKLHIQVLMSPASFDIEGVKGVLQTTSLMIEQFPLMHTYSGSIVFGDSRIHQFNRIYLELFPTYDFDILAESLTKELEVFLKDYILKKGNSKNNQYN